MKNKFRDLRIDMIKEIELDVDYSISFGDVKSGLCWLAVGITEQHYEDSKIFDGKKKEGIETINVKIIRFNNLFRLLEIKKTTNTIELVPLNLIEMCSLGKSLTGILQTVVSVGFTYESRNGMHHFPALKARDGMSPSALKGYWDSCPFYPQAFYFAVKEL